MIFSKTFPNFPLDDFCFSTFLRCRTRLSLSIASHCCLFFFWQSHLWLMGIQRPQLIQWMSPPFLPQEDGFKEFLVRPLESESYRVWNVVHLVFIFITRLFLSSFVTGIEELSLYCKGGREMGLIIPWRGGFERRRGQGPVGCVTMWTFLLKWIIQFNYSSSSDTSHLFFCCSFTPPRNTVSPSLIPLDSQHKENTFARM